MKGGDIMSGYRNNLPKYQSLGEMFSPYQVHSVDTLDRLTNRNDPDYSPPVVAAVSEQKPEKTPLSDFE